MSASEQTSKQPVIQSTAVQTTARIDWRKLFLPSLLIMFLPTTTAFLVDRWLGTLPYITIVAIVICFPTATFWVIRIALQEMDRVIAAVTPPAQDETAPESDLAFDLEAEPLAEDGGKSSSSP